MLTRLYIDNFRCFVNFEFKPGRRQLLLGSNGSGKSSFMDALLGLRRLITRGESTCLADLLEQRTRWTNRGRQSWELEASLDGQTYCYSLILDLAGSPLTPRVSSEIVKLNGKSIFEFIDGDVHLFNDLCEFTLSYPFDAQRPALATIVPRNDNRQLTRFQHWVASLLGFRINPFAMTSEAGEENSDPKQDFSNIASWYRRLIQEDRRQDQAMLQSLRSALDGFEQLSFDPAGKAKLMKADFIDSAGRRLSFDLEELSDGQRCVICLYAVLHFILAKGGTVILDEPDNFVALREIQPWLVTATSLIEGGIGQLLLISHHPEILNQWAPEYGVRFIRDGVGPVRVQDFHVDPESPITPAEVVARGWENE